MNIEVNTLIRRIREKDTVVGSVARDERNQFGRRKRQVEMYRKALASSTNVVLKTGLL